MEIPFNFKAWLSFDHFRIPILREQQMRKEVTTLPEVVDIAQ